MKPTSLQPQQNHHRRYDTVGHTIWLPLPKYVLDNIFHNELRTEILGALGTKIGDVDDWDPDTGISTVHDGGGFRILVARQEGLIKIQQLIRDHGNIWNITAKVPLVGMAKVKDQVRHFITSLGAHIAIAEPYEFFIGVNGVNRFKQRHLTEDPQWRLIQESPNLAGTIMLKSVALPTAPHGLPASHPELQAYGLVKERAQSIGGTSNLFSETKILLNSLFGDYKTDSKYVVDSRGSVPTAPITNWIHTTPAGSTSFIASGPVKQPPVVVIDNEKFTNTAQSIQDGTVRKTTLDGYVRNINPAFPSSFYHPHPDWIGISFVNPIAWMKNWKAASTIILIALATSEKSSTKYIEYHKSTTQVIDNQEMENLLWPSTLPAT